MNKELISNLKVILEYEKIYGNSFKVNSYNKAINIIELQNKKIQKIDDIKDSGIGKNILEKIIEFITTNKIEKVNEIKNDNKYNLFNILNNIHGFGPVKIKQLIDNINSFDDLLLPENFKLLNKTQQKGVKYFKDLNLRIPYTEGKMHYNIINTYLKIIDPNIEFDMVGSFRRKKDEMGDIDILIKNNNKFILENLVKLLCDKKYIIETLANGKKKFMGICKINDLPARRIDILLTEPEHYYFTLLYFTGSYEFNIEMRKVALKSNLSLSEYGFTDLTTKKLIDKNIKSEEDIFKVLNMKYIKPENR
tara:strand:+ start:728 stop:1648 length:921 start_codon:yes stop_codon:yes gene_type:complete